MTKIKVTKGFFSKPNYVVKMIRKRLFLMNKNYLLLICGDTGNGKSYTALTIASQIDPTFKDEVETRVVFTAKQFMKLLTSGKLDKGNVVIWDEAGVGIPAREWQDISNKMINYVLQTFRHKNLCVIFTTPSISFIDAGARRLFHAYVEMRRVIKKQNVARAKWYNFHHIPRTGKTYTPTLRDQYGERIPWIDFPKPSKEIIGPYELSKNTFTSELNSGIMKGLEESEILKNKKKYSIKEMVDISKNKNILKTEEVMLEFDIGIKRAQKISNLLKSDTPT